MKTTKLYVILLLVAVIFFGCKSKESVLLRLKYAKADEQHYTIAVKYVCSADIHMNTSMGVMLLIDSVSKGSEFFVTSKIDAIKTDINLGNFLGNDFNENYDSKTPYNEMSPEELALGDKYDSVMSKYYSLSYNNRGEILKPFNLYGKTVAAPYGAGLVQIAYPERKVKVGDTWTVNMQSPLASSVSKVFAADCIFTYVINDITADKVMINVDIKIQSKGLMAGFTRAFKANGVYTVNRANGRIDNGYLKIPAKSCDEALVSITTE